MRLNPYSRWTQEQRDELREAQRQRLLHGDYTSWSGGGKSGSKSWSLSPHEILRLLDIADGIGTGVSRTYFDVREIG